MLSFDFILGLGCAMITILCFTCVVVVGFYYLYQEAKEIIRKFSKTEPNKIMRILLIYLGYLLLAISMLMIFSYGIAFLDAIFLS